jgi:transcriptional regulator with XRE-family HTH domain
MQADRPHSVSCVVGRRIAAARRAAGLSQRELAAHLGWPRDTLINYEYGRRAIDVDRLVLIAGALDCHPATLLLDADDVLAAVIERVRADAELVQQVAFFLDTLTAEQEAAIAEPGAADTLVQHP